jgi:hypothetical protein
LDSSASCHNKKNTINPIAASFLLRVRSDSKDSGESGIDSGLLSVVEDEVEADGTLSDLPHSEQKTESSGRLNPQYRQNTVSSPKSNS